MASKSLKDRRVQNCKQILFYKIDIGRDDIQFIQEIVKDVGQKLESIYPRSAEPKGLVGINKVIADMEKLLRVCRTIGLWGIGGIGKTTIAKALFKKYSYSLQYIGHCFLKDIRENSGKLESLHEKLIKELLNGENIHIDIEYPFVESRLKSKTVFIVLDDVDKAEHIEYLVKGIGPNSRIIITSRDRHVLKGGVDKIQIHQIERLDSKESLRLFNFIAFKMGHPQMAFEELLENVANYAQGLPLALKLLGSYLQSRSKEKWESAFTNLKKYPHEPIKNELKLSYDGLNKGEKEIFLDIAFFFKGQKKDDVKRFLNACGIVAAIGLEILEDKALITISNVGEVEMHDLIQDMGWRRVETCEEEPKRYS